jgi:hypothetical protein
VIKGSGRGLAFEISADIPLTAYDILPFGGARSHFPSAELLFPTSVWGDNYVTMAPPAGTHNVARSDVAADRRPRGRHQGRAQADRRPGRRAR